jgi:hypothetical protein
MPGIELRPPSPYTVAIPTKLPRLLTYANIAPHKFMMLQDIKYLYKNVRIQEITLNEPG